MDARYLSINMSVEGHQSGLSIKINNLQTFAEIALCRPFSDFGGGHFIRSNNGLFILLISHLYSFF
jgi:hypothetical protein